MITFEELKGKIILKVDINYDSIRFILNTGDIYLMHHEQDCCESVIIDDIDGDWNDIIKSTILIAEELSNSDSYSEKDEESESFTWTFYKLATINGYLDIRWFGSSNGYYSEGVNFDYIETDEELKTIYLREMKLERVINK